MYWAWVEIQHVTSCNRSHTSVRCRYILCYMLDWDKHPMQYTIELCMYLQTNRIYVCRYSTLLHEEIHTKIKLFYCDDSRYDVHQWLKLALWFSNHQWLHICYSHFVPFSADPLIYFPLCYLDIDLAFKTLTWYATSLINN